MGPGLGARPHLGPPATLHRALRRMAGLVFLLVFWVLAGACQRHGVGGFLLCNSSSSSPRAARWRAPTTRSFGRLKKKEPPGVAVLEVANPSKLPARFGRFLPNYPGFSRVVGCWGCSGRKRRMSFPALSHALPAYGRSGECAGSYKRFRPCDERNC